MFPPVRPFQGGKRYGTARFVHLIDIGLISLIRTGRTRVVIPLEEGSGFDQESGEIVYSIITLVDFRFDALLL
jgi:hypothetical protein